ncbi:hypothetical protein HMPREF0813_01129 [Streptococcus anginosus F0211]|uniref:Uncharacterized protein n=1 Tax=Streptococcus anginosus F0211 TaxID=706437 RepID=E6J1K3_STRAP|nr:hypothetical protein HMPREF0813_01129 [Streptococcus anginosus F0211]
MINLPENSHLIFKGGLHLFDFPSNRLILIRYNYNHYIIKRLFSKRKK